MFVLVGSGFAKRKQDGRSNEMMSAVRVALREARHCPHCTPLANTGEHQQDTFVPMQVENASVIALQG